MQATFRTYDCENDEDRACIEENRRTLRENFAAHWITLRPRLALACPSDIASDPASTRAANDRIYAAALTLNERLAALRAERQERLSALETILSDSLAILRSEGNDWLSARAGDDRMTAWVRDLSDDLPAALAPIRAEWSDHSDRYRRLLAAYTAERDTLFSRDTTATDGFFAVDWQQILDGTLPDERWADLRATLSDMPSLSRYVDLLDALRRISSGTGARLEAIRERGSDRRMAQDLANRPDLLLYCLRGAAYRDPAWGDTVCNLFDDIRRAEFETLLRRRQETCDLIERRRQAYGAYREMYGDD